MFKDWYAVYTRSHFEKKVDEVLRKKSVTTFLPMRIGKVRIAGMYRFAEVPLYSSYLFINVSLNSDEYYNVLNTTGVSCIVKRGNKPCPVSHDVIYSLKKLVQEMNKEITVITDIKRGEPVRIVRGPLRGAVGEMLSIDNSKFKFIVNIDILGRAVEVSISPDCVTAL